MIDGIISVLDKNGNHVGDIILENFCEITGIYISPRVKECLFFTEKNSNGIFKLRLSSFYSELDKMIESRENMALLI